MRFSHTIRFLALAAAFVAAACSDNSNGPATNTVAAVAVIPGNRTMQVGETFTYTGRVLDDDGDIIGNRAVVWVSSNSAVATVSPLGVVTAIAAGNTTISASADSKTGTSQLTVTPGAVTKIDVAPSIPMMVVGETLTLTAVAKNASGQTIGDAPITWSVDDASVAEVDQSGRVTAKAKGSAVISATSGGVVGTSNVTVNNVPVASVVVTPTAIVLQTAQTKQLTAVLRDAKGNVLTGRVLNWSSDNKGAANVSATGLITAVSPGYATIVAASEGVTFGVAVTVIEDDLSHDLIYSRTATNGDQQIFMMNPAQGTSPVLLNAGSVSRDPSPSPAGDRFAFTVSMFDVGTQQRVDDIYAVNRNGLNIKRLTTAPGVDDQPAWSPVGNRIAYRHIDTLYARGDIWVMNADGSAPLNLTAGMTGWMLSAPAWSPDGQRLAFAGSNTGVTGTTTGIWIMNADGSDKELITSTLTGFDGQPAWSPDGTRIAFARWYAGDADLAIVSVAGGPVTRILITGDQFSPAWSPDGSVIAFTSVVSGSRPVIYTVKPNGTDVRLRTNPIFGGGSEPAWIVR